MTVLWAELSLEEIKEIDRDISLLETQLQRLRAQRNLKIPMARLPVDVMIHIFRFCVPHGRSKTRWLAFTHVCRSWRIIALNQASLWTSIDFSNINLARVMLERSKNAALDISIPRILYGQAERWQDVLDDIQHQVHRVRHLHVNMCRVDLMRAFVHGFQRAAPSLRSLEIWDYANLDLQSGFLGGEAPLLTDLRLYFTYISWDSPLLRNLTHLELGGDSCSNLPTGNQFLDALRRMPMLSVLKLTQILPRIIEGTAAVSLPNLQELALLAETDDIEGCAAVLGHLLFPEATVIRVSCYSESRSDGVFDTVFSQLSSLFSNSASQVESPRTIKSMSVDFETGSGPCSVTVNARNTDIPAASTTTSSRLSLPIIRLDFEWNRSYSQIVDEIQAAIALLPTNSLESLHIRGYSGVDGSSEVADESNGDQPPVVNILPKVMESLLWSTSIKTLALDGFSYVKELPGLLSMIHASADPPICFEDYADEIGSILNQLLGILESRSENGRKVEKLILRNCDTILPEQTALLRQLVGELDWDFEEMALEVETQAVPFEGEQ
ncbi:hypothetical protein VNI00_004562 [Paramarasmius palmivorus]|uniref:F-box domain-containing protein n=1 Tax=Paramarasmius palmivorus TaxID=297713 RepID=A0AAW0DFE3_9AGAR